MRVVVTGGLGFIGSYLVDRLLHKGHEVEFYDDLSNPSSHFPVIDREPRSVLDFDKLERTCEDAEIIYHLACRCLPESLENPRIVHDVNATGTLNVCEVARKHDLPLVYVSSSEVYGNTPEIPSTEDAPLRPTNCYGVSKLAGELFCRQYQNSYGLKCTIVRPALTYGPGQREDKYAGVVTRFLKAARDGRPLEIHGSGEQTRDFTFVSDTVEGILLSAGAYGCTVNIGSGVETSINRFAELVAEMYPKVEIVHVGDRVGQVDRQWLDVTRARRLGYEPKVKLEDGVRKLAQII